VDGELLDDELPDDEPVSAAGFDSEPDVPPDAPSVEPELELEPAFGRVPLVEDRSFFAQPEPLKWIAGVPSALRIVPSWPQLGQKRGPVSLIPWITSTRCLQSEQT
jgi:hypothetical protein